jgi:hypothetical protein
VAAPSRRGSLASALQLVSEPEQVARELADGDELQVAHRPLPPTRIEERRAADPAIRDWRDKYAELVDEVSLEEGPIDLATALEE